MIEITKFVAEHDWCPFDIWFDGLKDKRARARIQIRIDRLRLGNEGHWRSVGSGVRELKINEGKGYRVYYGWTGKKVVLLLCGGDKSSQANDIKQAKAFWSEYNEN